MSYPHEHIRSGPKRLQRVSKPLSVTVKSKAWKSLERGIRRFMQTPKANEPADIFLQEHPGIEEEDDGLSAWAGVRMLGAGGQGCAGLFVKHDKKGHVIGRIVAKLVKLKRNQFLAKSTWPSDPKYKFLKPREAYVHELLTKSKPDKSAIVKFLGCSVQHMDRTYRIYLEYLAGGGLDALFDAQFDERGWGRFIPEPVLWEIFLHLAKAALEMANVKGVGDNEYVVHQDMKPDNAWLDLDSGKHPIPKVGDLGSARLTADAGQLGPKGYRSWNDPVTLGWQAPEQVDFRQPLTSATNIWQVGKIMRCLASLRVPSNEEDYEAEQVMRWRAAYPAQTEDIDDRLQLSKNARLTYSDELNTLILECLNWIPHQRIPPDALVWNINLLIGTFKAATTPDEAHGFDQRDVCKNFWQVQKRTTDIYKVGMSFKPLDLE